MEMQKDDISSSSAGLTVDPLNLAHLGGLIAAFVVLYDHLITIGLEVEFIWFKRWSYSKVLFLICRYLGDLVSVLGCIVYMSPQPTVQIPVIYISSCYVGGITFFSGISLGFYASQVILQLRIRALYGRKSRIPACVTVAFIMENVVGGFIALSNMGNVTYYTEVRPGLIVCDIGNPPPHSYFFFFPIIIFEGLLFALAFHITYRHYQHLRSSVSWQPLTLIELLLRDNFIYFFVTFVTYIVNLIAWINLEPKYYPAISCCGYAIITIMACRLVLNLSQAYHRPPATSQFADWWSWFGEGTLRGHRSGGEPASSNVQTQMELYPLTSAPATELDGDERKRIRSALGFGESQVSILRWSRTNSLSSDQGSEGSCERQWSDFGIV